jgi:[acyl-carrier-protein] S-malonyltransferase
MKLAFVFPGQGAQSVGMMSAYGNHPIVRKTFDEASQVLGRDLWAIAEEGPVTVQNLTTNTQPLMLTAAVAVWRLWQDMGGAMPSLLAGHSLGEYTAWVAAESLSLSEAVPLVAFRAQAMQEAVPEGSGAMAAVLGLSAAVVTACCEQASDAQLVEAVNFNAPEQTVIAGHREAVMRAVELCKSQGAKRAVLLPVSAPFHCRLMIPAAQRLSERLDRIDLRPPKIPVINNVEARMVSEPAAIRQALVQQAASPVRWVESMRALRHEGVTHIVECGPGKVLAGLIKRCVPDVIGAAMNDRVSLEQTMAHLKPALQG